MQITMNNVKSISTEKESRGGGDDCPEYEVLDIDITDDKGQEHQIHLLGDPGTFVTTAIDATEIQAAYYRGVSDGLKQAWDKVAAAMGVEAEA